MAVFYVGDGATNGGSDANSGSRLITLTVQLDGDIRRHLLDDSVLEVPMALPHFLDFGEFGFPPPENPRIKVEMALTGDVFVTREGPLNTTEVPMVVVGQFVTNAVVTTNETVTPTFVVGTIGLAVFVGNSTIVFAVDLRGEIVFDTFGALTRDFFADLNEERPTIGWVIQGPLVTHYSQIVDAPQGGNLIPALNEPFLVSADFDPDADPILFDLGATPNKIGMVIQQTVNGVLTQAVRFREPELNEVIVFQESSDLCQTLEWNGTAWVELVTMPQRALRGQLTFDLFDPDKVYDYYAKVLGLCHRQWSYDTKRLFDFLDPTTVPENLLPLLADNFGSRVDTATPVERRRELVRQFVQIQKTKGVPQSITDALRILGFLGYAKHIWVIPGGSSTDYVERPFGYDTTLPSTYYPASQVSIHLNKLDGDPLIIDSSTRTEVAEFLALNVLPAHVIVRQFVTDVSVGSAEAIEVSDSLVITQV